MITVRKETNNVRLLLRHWQLWSHISCPLPVLAFGISLLQGSMAKRKFRFVVISNNYKMNPKSDDQIIGCFCSALDQVTEASIIMFPCDFHLLHLNRENLPYLGISSAPPTPALAAPLSRAANLATPG